SAQLEDNAIGIAQTRDSGTARDRETSSDCRISPGNIFRPAQIIGAANEVCTADPQRPDTDTTDAQRIGSVGKPQCAATTANTDNEPCPGDCDPDCSRGRIRR